MYFDIHFILRDKRTQVGFSRVFLIYVYFIIFRYAEDFWALYHHLQEASSLGSGQDYCLFKVELQSLFLSI